MASCNVPIATPFAKPVAKVAADNVAARHLAYFNPLPPMKKRENNLSLALGIPGLLMQVVGQYMSISATQQGAQPPVLASLITIGGTALLIAGLCFYAIAKGRTPLWGLMGLLSCIGLLVLAMLKDLSGTDS